MAHAVPEIRGIMLLPFIPKRRIILSIKKTTRLIYPVSSKTAINKNKIAICGIKIRTPPIPGMIPSANKSVRTPFGKLLFAKSEISAKVPSIKSIGNEAQSKID